MTADKEGNAMTGTRSIVLISDNAEMTRAVGAAVESLEDRTLQVADGTLSSVNGAALQFLNDNALLIFRLEELNDRDLVSQMREKVGSSGKLLALSDRDISLSEARALEKSGVNEILPFPVDEGELCEQIRRLTTLLPALAQPEAQYRHGPQRLGHVIGICPVRGGIGASTLAVNLADQLQGRTGTFRKKSRYRVAMVDLDIQFGTIATELDLEPSPGLYKMGADGVIPDRTFLDQCLAQHESGIEVLTAPDEFMPFDAFSRKQISALIEVLRREFDFVVLDLPRTLVEWLGVVVAACDRMLVVTDSSVPSIRQAYRLIDFFAQERLEPPVEIVVGHEKKPLFKAGHHAEAEKVLGRELRHWLPLDPRSARVALDRGQLLSSVANRSALAKAIRSMSGKILTEMKNRADTHARGAA